MLYMVDVEFAQAALQAEWDAWYLQHVEVLLAVPGIRTAQRFECLTRWPSPYLTIYSVDSAEVFESEGYQQRGGRDSTGKWQPLMTHWLRNLFDGLTVAPAVSEEERLLVTESRPHEITDCECEFSWLENAGLDRTVPWRGIAVVNVANAGRIAGRTMGRVRVYRPLTPQLLASQR
jgi:hypothetical protein